MDRLRRECTPRPFVQKQGGGGRPLLSGDRDLHREGGGGGTGGPKKFVDLKTDLRVRGPLIYFIFFEEKFSDVGGWGVSANIPWGNPPPPRYH